MARRNSLREDNRRRRDSTYRALRFAPDVPVRIDVDPVPGGNVLVALPVGRLVMAKLVEVAIGAAILGDVDLSQQFRIAAVAVSLRGDDLLDRLVLRVN